MRDLGCVRGKVLPSVHLIEKVCWQKQLNASCSVFSRSCTSTGFRQHHCSELQQVDIIRLPVFACTGCCHRGIHHHVLLRQLYGEQSGVLFQEQGADAPPRGSARCRATCRARCSRSTRCALARGSTRSPARATAAAAARLPGRLQSKDHYGIGASWKMQPMGLCNSLLTNAGTCAGFSKQVAAGWLTRRTAPPPAERLPPAPPAAPCRRPRAAAPGTPPAPPQPACSRA